MSARSESLALLAKAATPTILGLCAAVLIAAPLRLFEGFAPMPILPLTVVFFWTIYDPDHLPPASVFVIGLIQDFMSGGPLGLWPAIYLMTQFFVMSQRSYFLGRDQSVLAMGFAIAAGGAAIIIWLLMSLISGGLLPLRGILFQMLATLATYPLLSMGFASLHRRVLVEE